MRSRVTTGWSAASATIVAWRPDPLKEFLPRSGVGVAGELGPLQHVFELGEKQGARDDLDAVVDECPHDQIGRTAPAADECGDEDAWVDDDPDHAAPRSRREERTSS